MKVYLAGKPEDHDRFNGYALDLQSRNLIVVSTWHQSGTVAELLKQQRQLEQNRKGLVMVGLTSQKTAPEHIRSTVNARLDAELSVALRNC
jgi:hypothetical protein